jgi:eukaryotic-like serine/threonine-protein kinase
MTLAPGARFGPYEVVSLVGVGGMGEVYKAHDTRLGRAVAIKVLSDAVARDADWQSRLIHEAKAASLLEHPHIVAIHDVCTVDGRSAIVMQIVEGRTLRQVIAGRGLGLHDALRYATQIADALACAHAHGIVHRDLKPDNVMIAADGVVKILDFGVAKRLQIDTSADSATTAATIEGQIVGTPAYMSPEQLRGEPAGTPTDIWSFGCVVYEMLSGRQAFRGATMMEIAVAVSGHDPDWSALPSDTPAHVRDVIRRCLARDANHRLHDMTDARIELEESLTVPAPVVARPIGRARFVAAAVAIAAIAVAAMVAWHERDPAPAPDVRPFTSSPMWEGQPAFSADGRQVAYVAGENGPTTLYVQLVGGADPLRLTMTPGALRPAWSPDGRDIAFLRPAANGYDVMIVPALSGAERRLAHVDADRNGLTWSADGRSVVTVARQPTSEADALVRISIETGALTFLTAPPRGEWGDSSPVVSPDGRSIAFLRRQRNRAVAGVFVTSADGGAAIAVATPEWHVTGVDWTADGRSIVYAGGPPGNSRLWRVSSGGGPASPLPFGEGAEQLAIARTGARLVYAGGQSDINIWRAGGPTSTTPASATKFIASTKIDTLPRYSPDGRYVAFVSNRSGRFAIWMCDATGTGCRRLAEIGDRMTGAAEWSPDGESVVFARPTGTPGHPQIELVHIAGGQTRTVTDDATSGAGPTWSPDGRSIFFMRIIDADGPAARPIWKVAATGGAAVPTPAKGRFPHISDDGRFMYFQKTAPGGPVWSIDLRSGEESIVLDEPVGMFDWSVWKQSLVYVRDDRTRLSVAQIDLTTHARREILTLDGRTPIGGITVSPDGRWIAYGLQDQIGSDLFLVEHFR